LVTGIVDSVSGVVGSAGSFISGTGIGLPKPVGIRGFGK
jgi:hypothetical protein